jgi:sugar-specific transcriptional regulator TrmB
VRKKSRKGVSSSRNKRRYLRISPKQLIEEDYEPKSESESDEQNDSMEKEEILKVLVDCGLSEYESKVYASLVLLGPSKAGTISKKSNVPQSKIYEILGQLTEKRMVEVFDGRPKEFKATDPNIVLKEILQQRMMKIDSLSSRVEEVSNFLRPKEKESTINGIWVVKGDKYREFFNRTAGMLSRSEKYVYAITRDFSRSSTLSKEVKKCVGRGVKINVVGMEDIGEKNYYKAKWYYDHGIRLRIFDTKIHPRIVVVDGKEILIRLDYNPNKRERFRFNSMWSEDPSLVTVMDNYMKSIWRNSKPVRIRDKN